MLRTLWVNDESSERKIPDKEEVTKYGDKVHQSGIHLILRQRSVFYLFLYSFKLAITPNIEHKLYEIFIDQSSIRKLPNNGSSIKSARVHKICATKKKINAIKNKNPIFFIV